MERGRVMHAVQTVEGITTSLQLQLILQKCDVPLVLLVVTWKFFKFGVIPPEPKIARFVKIDPLPVSKCLPLTHIATDIPAPATIKFMLLRFSKAIYHSLALHRVNDYTRGLRAHWYKQKWFTPRGYLNGTKMSAKMK
jgi:hypothetical protein